MRILSFILVLFLDILPGGKAYMKQLQPRDSILIADQIELGFTMDSLRSGDHIGLPDFSSASNDTLMLVRDWKVDTVKVMGPKKDPSRQLVNISASVILSPFEEGMYHLPHIPVQFSRNGKVDTLVFEAMDMEVKTMPVDTATFEIHDIKGQISYPVTFRELMPWILGALLLAAIVALAVYFIRKAAARKEGELGKPQDPSHIVALRELEKYRSDKYWAPEKQKVFYSGITDTLKVYIEDRFGVDAPEMTTAELFDALKVEKEITPELFNELIDLFERADFVKFAKHQATQQENASALPVAVRFVTTTYQSQIESNVL